MLITISMKINDMNLIAALEMGVPNIIISIVPVSFDRLFQDLYGINLGFY